MGIRNALVIHGHVEESRGTERLARRLDLLQMAAKGFFPLIEAENSLEARRPRKFAGHMTYQRVIQAMTNCALECLMQNSATPNAIELLQFGFDLCHLPRGPLLDNRRIETAELRHVEERPRALWHSERSLERQLISKLGPQLRQPSAERHLSRSLVERRPLEQ
jgi:hypothetical protein